MSCYILFVSQLLFAEIAEEKLVLTPVNQLHDTLLKIMQNGDSTNFDERYTELETIINNHFNTPLTSKVILSRYWKSLDSQQQSDFIDLFNRLTIATYVSRFDSFNNEFFKTLSVEPLKKNRFMVKTKLIIENDEPVSFNYIVQKDNDQWKIISVIANGINDLSLKRSEYSTVIKKQGFAALVSSIEDKINDLRAK